MIFFEQGAPPDIRMNGSCAGGTGAFIDQMAMLLNLPVETLEARLAHIVTPLTLSIIGCVVNGPGEARETDIGLTGGGNEWLRRKMTS